MGGEVDRLHVILSCMFFTFKVAETHNPKQPCTPIKRNIRIDRKRRSLEGSYTDVHGECCKTLANKVPLLATKRLVTHDIN